MMNRVYLIIATVFVAIIFVSGILPKYNHKQSMRVGSYNIRYAAEADEKSGNNWSKRKYPLVKIIQDYNYDIIGTQEANLNQKAELNALLKDYTSVSHPYGGQSGHGHHTITYFKKNRYDLLDSGVFWLSETPDIPSIGWDATDRRICQWVKLKDLNTNTESYFFNAHFYWKNHSAKLNSGPLIINQIKSIAGDFPCILVGDLNSEENTEQIKAISKFLYDASKIEKEEELRNWPTNLGGGNFKDPLIDRIDYIFLSHIIKPITYKVIKDKYDDERYPSDHLPILAEIQIKK